MTEVWIVVTDFWGEDGVRIHNVFATRDAADKWITDKVKAGREWGWRVESWEVQP